jgi:hypothetical protein
MLIRCSGGTGCTTCAAQPDERCAVGARVRRARRRVRLPPVTSQVVTGCWLHEPADRSQEERKGIGSGDVVLAPAQHSSPTLRSRPHLSHLHYCGYTLGLTHPSPSTAALSRHRAPCLLRPWHSVDARRWLRAGPSPLSPRGPRCLYEATCTYPGMSGRDISQGCCMVAADVKSNPLVQPPLLLEISIFWRF